MDKIFRALMSVMIVTFMSQFIIGCSEQEADGASASSSTSRPVDSTPIGSIEATGFWINAENTQHAMLVNSGSGFGTDCFIDASSTTNQLMNCYIDVLEGDLYMYDVEIQYNAPPKLCDHVTVTPAWHWNYSSGTGPKAVTLTTSSATDPPSFVSCTATNAANVTTACTANLELTNGASVDGPKCVYDKTDSKGTNCCFGEYVYTKIDTNTGDTTVTESSWAGDVKNCLGGAVQTSWSLFFQTGYPRSLIRTVKKDSTDSTVGLNESLKLTANVTSPGTSFSLMANHYETLGSPHAHDGYISASTSNVPYAVAPIDDLDGSPITAGSDAYVFSCLDSAFEVKHQIRTYIREWNTLTDFIAYQTSSGATYNPDVTGTEGVQCQYDGTFSDSCNDMTDFADILSNVGGTYTTTPGAGAAATRETYFPRVDYGGL